jgi:hypothetical protein
MFRAVAGALGYGSEVPRPSRLQWTAVAALTVHAGVAFLTWRTARPDALAANEAEGASVTETDVELEAPAEPAAASVTESPDHPQERATAVSPGSAEPSRTLAGKSPGAAAGEPSAPSSSASTADEGSWSFPSGAGGPAPASGPLAGQGLDTALRAAVGAAVAEDTRKKDEFARKHVIPLFTPHDLATGMVPGGELVTLTRDLVRRSLAPMNGRALLQFDTDGAGLVSSVRVLDVSSDRREWNEVAAEIAAAARTRPLRVPAGASGLAITLEVTSALKTVGGGKANPSTLERVAGAVLDPVDTIIDSNAPAQRVVATRIVDVQAF